MIHISYPSNTFVLHESRNDMDEEFIYYKLQLLYLK